MDSSFINECTQIPQTNYLQIKAKILLLYLSISSVTLIKISHTQLTWVIELPDCNLADEEDPDAY